MVDCLLPEGMREPTDLERAFILGAHGRFYRAKYATVMYEAGGLGAPWIALTIPGGTEVVTATTAGLPTMTLRPPEHLPDGTRIARSGIVVRERGDAWRWIPSLAIVADRRGARLAHGWIPALDLIALPTSGIAGNALQYDIAAQRCAQQASADAAAAERSAAIAAGLMSSSTGIATAVLSRQAEQESGGTPRPTIAVVKLFGDDLVPPPAPPPQPAVASGMGLAVVGTLAVVGALGLFVWLAGGTK